MEKARQRLDASKAELLSIKTTTTFWIHRHRHRRRARCEYADGPEDPDGSGPAELADYLREDAPQVVSARNAIQSLQHKLTKKKAKSQRRRVTS